MFNKKKLNISFLFLIVFLIFLPRESNASTSIEGVALNNPTNVYEQTSTDSMVLKAYSQGTILKYQSFSTEWYICKVYFNGQYTTGYIPNNAVENIDTTPETLNGVTLLSPTKVFSKPSESSTVLKQYGKDTVLKYVTFTSDWYKVTVYISGKAVSGYIKVSDLKTGDSNPTAYNGVALNAPTKVYSQVSTGSKVLKSYEQGRILSYQSFIPGWYKAKVYINGIARNGYISGNDVENGTNDSTSLSVRAITDKVYVRTYASSSAPSLKSYNRDTILKVKNFTSSWYKATVYVNGTAKTGYIFKNDTSTDLQEGSYLNLDLRKMANITATDIVNFFNATSPDNHLKNYAQSFIDAQTKYGVNATYLVAHAIWETGWGKSALSLYKNNLYGYGAYNVCPFTCGYYYPTAGDSINSVAYMVRVNYLTPGGAYYTQNGSNLIGMNVHYATDQNWKNGISSLMERIKPYDSRYYSSQTTLSLTAAQPGPFGRDIPEGKPYPTSTIINFPQGITGKITETVSFRTLPYQSDSTFITYLNNSATVEVLGYNTDVRLNGIYPYDYRWYRVLVNGQKGWVYGGSLSIQNLLQVQNVTTTLNIRNSPITGTVIGSAPANSYLKAVLKDGKPEIVNGWYHVYLPNSSTSTGYVSGEFIIVVNN